MNILYITLLTILLFLTMVKNNSTCKRNREVDIYIRYKEKERNLIRCNGYSNFDFSYVYWLVNGTFVEKLNNTNYFERIHLNKNTRRCGSKSTSYLVLINITDAIKNSNLSCVLVDPGMVLIESITLSNYWW
ncbi:IL-18 binding protein [Brazilian porcupinepox virus 1]|nr:IL-18 binding protein [Brazilian porcupinepox virus 1]